MPLRFSPSRGAGALVLNSLVRGPTGAAATATVGTTTTLAAGASATVANSGSTSAAVFDFGIPRGADAGFKYTFSTSTNTAVAPSAGGVTFNSGTPASITQIAISATDADGNTARPTWLTVDDSTSTARGTISWKRYDGVQIVLNIGGTFTDNTTWLQLTVTHSSGTTLFSSGDKIYGTWNTTGNKGADGSGTFPGSSTDNAVVRFDGTGGGTVKNSTVTIDDSGVVTGALFPNTGLKVLDTNASHSLVLVPGSDLTANRNLTLTTGDAARTVTISADATISQDYSTSGSPTFAGVTVGNTGLKVLDTNASHSLVIVPGSDLTANRNLTLTTGDAARTLTISGDHTLPGGTSAVLAGNQTLTGGFKATAFSAGTKSSGTFTPDPLSGNLQTATNGGAHTLAPPGVDCSLVLQYTNNGSAGAVTTSGFTKKTGDSITTTNGDDFLFFVTQIGSFSHLHVQALQ